MLRARAPSCSRGAVPASARPDAPIEQRDVLVGGELRQWDGAMRELLSPIGEEAGGGPRQIAAGSHPLLGAEEALTVPDRRLRARVRP
jgi:glyceraldehyde-3-phosphate dehydrogenase (NADP+)